MHPVATTLSRVIQLTAFATLALGASPSQASLTERVSCKGSVTREFCDTTVAGGGAQALAIADYGTLKSKSIATSSYVSTGPWANMNAEATAAFSDAFIVNATGLSGKTGSISLSLSLDYFLITSHDASLGVGQGSARTTLTFDVLGAAETVVYQRIVSTGFSHDATGVHPNSYFMANDKGEVVPFTRHIDAQFDFVFGRAMTLRATLTTSAHAWFATSAIADASRSVYWGGIQSVSFGDAVVDYSATSGSLTDYRLSQIPQVPEPATLGLLLSGLAVVATACRRRRTK